MLTFLYCAPCLLRFFEYSSQKINIKLKISHFCYRRDFNGDRFVDEFVHESKRTNNNNNNNIVC